MAKQPLRGRAPTPARPAAGGSRWGFSWGCSRGGSGTEQGAGWFGWSGGIRHSLRADGSWLGPV
jgi:hypothetical protein